MKKMPLNIGFITTVSGRWPRELPEKRNVEYSGYLKGKYPECNIITKEGLAVDNQDVKDAAHFFKQNEADLIIMVIGAFTGDYAATHLAEKVSVPLIIWAPFEPPFDGDRLMSNALVSATMNIAAVKRLKHTCYFIYGNYDTPRVQIEHDRLIKLYGCKKSLANVHLGLVGYRPTGFYSSQFDETLIRETFGITMEETDIAELMGLGNAIEESKVSEDIKALEAGITSSCLPEGHLKNHSKLKLGMEKLIENKLYDAVSLKCWPELGNLKSTPCGMISRFADEGFIIGCESDVDATITMIIQSLLSKEIPFMTDLININEENNSALFWHCGQCARKNMNPKYGIEMNNHPLAGQGLVFEGTIKPGNVTIARMTYIDGQYKLFLAKGKAVETPKLTKGVMTEVIAESNVLDMIYQICEKGIPHHYSLIWDDIYEDMKDFSRLLGIDIIEAGK